MSKTKQPRMPPVPLVRTVEAISNGLIRAGRALVPRRFAVLAMATDRWRSDALGVVVRLGVAPRRPTGRITHQMSRVQILWAATPQGCAMAAWVEAAEPAPLPPLPSDLGQVWIDCSQGLHPGAEHSPGSAIERLIAADDRERRHVQALVEVRLDLLDNALGRPETSRGQRASGGADCRGPGSEVTMGGAP